MSSEDRKPIRTCVGCRGRVDKADLVDLPLIVPHPDTQRIQELHITISHILCQFIEDALFFEG